MQLHIFFVSFSDIVFSFKVNNPDELSMMTYVSAFRNYLSDEEVKRREELARKKRTADPALCYAFGPGKINAAK